MKLLDKWLIKRFSVIFLVNRLSIHLGYCLNVTLLSATFIVLTQPVIIFSEKFFLKKRRRRKNNPPSVRKYI